MATLVGQCAFGIVLGYEDLNEQDDLRHDPVMPVLAGKLEAWRSDCAPVAGKWTSIGVELCPTAFFLPKKRATAEALSERKAV